MPKIPNQPNPYRPRPLLPDITIPDERMLLPISKGGFYDEKTGSMAPYDESLSIETANAQLIVDVPWEFGDLAAYQFMGISYVDGTRLRRSPPLMHPFYNHLRCRQVLNSKGVGWRGEDPIQPQVLDASTPRPYYAGYDLCRLTLNFVPLPFAIKTDDQIDPATNGEWTRWCWIRTDPGYESISIQGGSGEAGGNYQFDRSCGVTVVGSETKSVIGATPFAGGRNIPYAMPKLLITWFDVPLEYLVKDPAKPYYYDNLYAGLQCVNDKEFLGFPAQTLLMDCPTIDTRPNPIPDQISQTPKFLANITFVMHILNQQSNTVGDSSVGVGSIHPQRGHNMAIYKFDFKWYPYSLDGSGAASKLLYKTYDYRKLFQKPT